MKAVVLNGATAPNGTLGRVYELFSSELEGRSWEIESFTLREIDIAHCVGCFGCWIKTPGICLIDDPARTIARGMVQSDLVIYLTPVTFGGYSSELKKAVDRCICLISPFFARVKGETHHKRRYERYPSLLAVGVLPQPDGKSERLFKALVGRNAINLHSPAHAAGVVTDGQGADQIRDQLAMLLAQVGVGK
jgi:multimeric flavodoxin WrbA